jgi:hypothetical protein
MTQIHKQLHRLFISVIKILLLIPNSDFLKSLMAFFNNMNSIKILVLFIENLLIINEK